MVTHNKMPHSAQREGEARTTPVTAIVTDNSPHSSQLNLQAMPEYKYETDTGWSPGSCESVRSSKVDEFPSPLPSAEPWKLKFGGPRYSQYN